MGQTPSHSIVPFKYTLRIQTYFAKRINPFISIKNNHRDISSTGYADLQVPLLQEKTSCFLFSSRCHESEPPISQQIQTQKEAHQMP
jgi:hypothetical protein